MDYTKNPDSDSLVKSPLSNRRFDGDISPLPVRFDAVFDPSGVVCSLDMVRLKLGFSGASMGEELSSRVCTFVGCDDYHSYTSKVRPGGWHVLHVLDFGDTSCSLGIGHMGGNCRINYAQGFLEFNPNKLGDSPSFLRFLDWLRPFVSHCLVSRFDLAVDVPAERNSLRLAKHGRSLYSCTVSDSLTEYLGRRSSAGFVKVYDKAVESSLPFPLSRIELTCDGVWSLDGIQSHWPCVYRPVLDTSAFGGVLLAFLRALSFPFEAGYDLESYLLDIPKDSRRKIRAALCADAIPFPFEGAGRVLMQALGWAGRFL